MFIEVNGQKLYYETCGRGQDLLMLHGNGEDHTIFNEAAHVLKDHFRVWLIDSRGHGKSSPCDQYHYEDMADDIVAFLEEKDLCDVILYGFSDGGIVGLLCAMKSDRLSRLIISGANLTPAGIREDTLQEIKQGYKETRDPKMKMMLEEPGIRKKDLRRIEIPVLVLAGENDCIREEETRRISAWLKNAECVILEKEDHDSYITHQTKIAYIILEYVKKKEEDA